MIEIQRVTAETEPLFAQADERRLDSEDVAVRIAKGGFTLEYRPRPNALWNIVSRDEAEEAALCAGEKFIALLDGEPAGRVALRIGEHRLARVDGLCVPLALRRRGAGRAMLEFAEGWARERGLRSILVTHFASSPGAGLADVTLLCGADESPLQLGSVGARIAQMYLLDVLFSELCRRNLDACRQSRARIAAALADKHL